ncbi:GTA major capsid protein [Acetobacter nitrogenifigens DSM 23921 = NBRC 105050]|uniref:Phage capsid protein n=1 Tax=Acetobacter nitrogenifigens DSM 23921 = NBRC 105050 TaxID=1120919 RepID=A0A511XFF9_9PROT|nr:phage major capsid protein [Acetobacter nitrogenifigens]GBQ96474.1 GTA major capsid protein [Acetobacter nitrogenifigens DSM 23921 = NBRC 105050]GEN61693.1 phage capsid protein [Acetobacter nitrogenifigens DSM 23921 = NBRC 105050]
MTIKELRAKRATLIENARALVSGDTATTEQIAQFDAMMAEANAMKAQIDRIEQAHAADAELAQQVAQRAAVEGISASQRADDDQRETRVFMSWLRGGMDGVAADDRIFAHQRIVTQSSNIRNAQGTTPGAAGGYLVPPAFVAQLLVALKDYFQALNYFDEIATDTGADLPWPTNDDTSRRAKIIAENTQIGQGNLSFGQTTLKAFLYATDAILVPWTLMQDSFMDLDAFIRGALTTSFGRTLADDLTTGAGGASGPTGVLTASAVGATAAGASPTYDDFVELAFSVDRAYRTGAVFMMNDQTIKVLAKLKDNQGRPLWVPSVQAGVPDMFAGYPIVYNNSMPDIAAGAQPVLFGNLKNYKYRVVRDVSIVRLNERYADYLQTGYFGFGRFGGGLPSAAQPLKSLKMPGTAAAGGGS